MASQPTKKSSVDSKFYVNFLLGGVSAAISKTAVAPIERVKTLIQTQDSIPDIRNGKIPRYSGILNCFTRVCKDQGILSLWRGNLVNVIRYFPTQAFNFALKDTFKTIFPRYDKNKDFGKFFLTNIASGSLGGAGSLLIVYPLDFARTRLATDIGKTGSREFKGLFDCIFKVSKRTGILSLYRGFGSSIQGIVVYRGFYFGMYDSLRELLFQHSNPNIFYKWMLAQAVTTSSGIVSYPFDTVRRRMMMMAGRKDVAEIQYKGTIDCFIKIFKQEGFKGFFKGAFANVMRGAGAALVLVLYDEIGTIVYKYI